MNARLRLIPGIPARRIPEYAALSREDKKRVRMHVVKRGKMSWQALVGASIASVGVLMFFFAYIYLRLGAESLGKENAALRQTIQNLERARAATGATALVPSGLPSNATNRGWMQSIIDSQAGHAFLVLLLLYSMTMTLEYMFIDIEIEWFRQAMRELGLLAPEA